MKNIFLLFISLFFFTTTFSQTYTVTGKVIDKNTRLPLLGASVFAQNTTFGVATDAEGNFKLKLPYGGYELIVTFTGYETEDLRINSATADDKNLVIELNAKEKSMQEVSIVISNEIKDGWEKYGQFFTVNLANKLLLKIRRF
jgi:hypothetical protein